MGVLEEPALWFIDGHLFCISSLMEGGRALSGSLYKGPNVTPEGLALVACSLPYALMLEIRFQGMTERAGVTLSHIVRGVSCVSALPAVDTLRPLF